MPRSRSASSVKIVGEAERVVELERGLAGQFGIAAQPRGRIIEKPQPVLERLAEARLLAFEHFLDQRLCAAEFGIRLTHLGDQRGHQAVHQRVLRAKQVRVAHRAAHDPAQDIAAALVRRQHAVRKEKAGGAQMIGDHPVAGGARTLGGGVGEVFGRRDQRAEGVDLIIVVLALEHRGDPLEPHAGVD